LSGKYFLSDGGVESKRWLLAIQTKVCYAIMENFKKTENLENSGKRMFFLTFTMVHVSWSPSGESGKISMSLNF